MKTSFYDLHVYYKDNDELPEMNYYLPNWEAVQKRIEYCCEHNGNVKGYVSKYTDWGDCYLMDMDFGKNGFIDFEAKKEGVVITWNK